MKLIDLHPNFLDAGGPGISDSKTGAPVPRTEGVGIMFDCPCGKCGTPVYVPFSRALDGTPYPNGRPVWERTGETFDTLTLRPSIQRIGGCGWHGYLTNGELIAC
jgi:hypothetical protein